MNQRPSPLEGEVGAKRRVGVGAGRDVAVVATSTL